MLEDSVFVMEKKGPPRQSSSSSKPSSAIERKNDPGNNNSNNSGRHYGRYGRRRDSAGGGGGGRGTPPSDASSSAPRKPLPQKARCALDKRPRQRSGAGSRQREEVAGEVSQRDGSRAQSTPLQVSQLLRFNYGHREHRSGDHRSPRFPQSRPRRGGRRTTPFSKERYLQANCQFVVRSSGDYTLQACDPDALVSWQLVEQVRTFSFGETTCPICLHPPTAGQMTRCGHVYCYACILHYLGVGEGKEGRKCPICDHTFTTADLRSVCVVERKEHKVGDVITLQLMKKARGSTYTAPLHHWQDRHGHPQHLYDKRDTEFAKVLVASSSEIQTCVIDEERRALVAQLNDAEDSEVCFIESALMLLSEREQRLQERARAEEENASLMESLGQGGVGEGAVARADSKGSSASSAAEGAEQNGTQGSKTTTPNPNPTPPTVSRPLPKNLSFDGSKIRKLYADAFDELEEDNEEEEEEEEEEEREEEEEEEEGVSVASEDPWDQEGSEEGWGSSVGSAVSMCSAPSLPDVDPPLTHTPPTSVNLPLGEGEKEKEEEGGGNLPELKEEGVREGQGERGGEGGREDAPLTHTQKQPTSSPQCQEEEGGGERGGGERGRGEGGNDDTPTPTPTPPSTTDKDRASETCRAQRGKTGGRPNQTKEYSYFYQASDGQHVYLHSVNAQCITQEYGDLQHGPPTITAKIIDKDVFFMKQDVRQRHRYLSHVPITCECQVVEVQLRPPTVSNNTLKCFHAELKSRAQRRQKVRSEDRRQARRQHIEERISYGIYPEVKLRLDSTDQFPAPSPDVGDRRHSGPLLTSPPHTPHTPHPHPHHHQQQRSSSSSDSTTELNPGAAEFMPTWGTDITPSAPPSFSFAAAVKKAKQPVTPPSSVWGAGGGGGTPSSSSLPHPPQSSRGVDSEESDNEDRVPVPTFQTSFSDAISARLDQLTTSTSPRDASQSGEAGTEDATSSGSGAVMGGKKKKKKKGSVLFSTAMYRK